MALHGGRRKGETESEKKPQRLKNERQTENQHRRKEGPRNGRELQEEAGGNGLQRLERRETIGAERKSKERNGRESE